MLHGRARDVLAHEDRFLLRIGLLATDTVGIALGTIACLAIDRVVDVAKVVPQVMCVTCIGFMPCCWLLP